MFARIAVIVAALGMLGCTTTTEVLNYDLTERSGLYVVGYATDDAVRRRFEDEVVADLKRSGMQGYPSHADFPAVTDMAAGTVASAANEQKAIAVLVVNQVVPGEGGVIENPARITPEHPDLVSFYEYTKSLEAQAHQGADPDEAAFAEVNAFLLQDDAAKLVWSGTLWSFEADGRGGAITGLAQNVAEQLAEMRDALLANPLDAPE